MMIRMHTASLGPLLRGHGAPGDMKHVKSLSRAGRSISISSLSTEESAPRNSSHSISLSSYSLKPSNIRVDGVITRRAGVDYSSLETSNDRSNKTRSTTCLVKIGSSMSADNSEAFELAAVMKRFYKMHTVPKSKKADPCERIFDLTKFLDAQAILAEVLGRPLDKLMTTSAFVHLCKEQDQKLADIFSDWQRDQFESQGMDIEQMRETLQKVASKASDGMDEEQLKKADLQALYADSMSETAQGTAIKNHSQSCVFSPTIHTVYSNRGSRRMHVGTAPEFKKLMNHTKETPPCYTKSILDLARYLTKPTTSDEQKAWVIFCWICFHVDYDMDSSVIKSSHCDPDTVLQNRRAKCTGYSSMFTELARAAGVDAHTISGLARNSLEEIDDDYSPSGRSRSVSFSEGLCNRKQNERAHSWNAVRLHTGWLLVDCCRGAGFCSVGSFTRAFRQHWFGAPPSEFSFSHFPEESRWQLQIPVSYDTFMARPYVNADVFFGHGLFFENGNEDIDGILEVAGPDFTGCVKLGVPSDVKVTCLLGKGEMTCNMQQRSGSILTIQFSLNSFKAREVPLEIHVSRFSGRAFQHACSFIAKRR
eukprot:TRINITY_DN89960_c0_g1_i1.p1 TRINITY_DN89960_c0_g1~~TRINITY_DN89960_c0_g1_i1.p1  ORF type:complete len:592 (+),score=88.69 TRINITY_DN89960_c0_g1_i1:113-1888(+)